MSEQTTIGPAALLDDTPTIVSVTNRRYILHQDASGAPVLYSAVCPHQRGRVKISDDATFLCPNHRWRFDPETGECVEGGNDSLDAYDVEVVGDTLEAALDSP